MKTIDYHDAVDKTDWPDGPWKTEPDKRQWPTEAGLPGLIVRGPVGALCGYVGVPAGHPFHGLHYDQATERGMLDAHGGLTFSRGCSSSENEARNICHIAEDGDPDDVWWFGFDCAHLNDIIPCYDSFSLRQKYGEEYRDVDYVTAEVERLAKQLVAT